MWKLVLVGCALAGSCWGATLEELHDLSEGAVNAFAGIYPTGENVVEQLYFTAVVESGGGKYDKQIGGCAVSCFQIEEATANDIYKRYLANRKGARTALLRYAEVSHQTANQNVLETVRSNPKFAAGIARLVYAMNREPVPTEEKERAGYWKRAYQKGGSKGLSAEQAQKHFNNLTK